MKNTAAAPTIATRPTDAELRAHAELGGRVITPRYGTTEAERAELRKAGYRLADETAR